MGGHHADGLGHVHRRPAAHGHQAVAALALVERGGLVHELDVRVRPDLGEDDDVVAELLQRPAGETGRDDARVGDQQRPRDPEPGDELAQPGERAGPVHELASACR